MGFREAIQSRALNTLSFAIRDQSGADSFIISSHCCPVAVHSCSFLYCDINKWCSSDAVFTSSHVAHDTFCLCTEQRNTRTAAEAFLLICTKTRAVIFSCSQQFTCHPLHLRVFTHSSINYHRDSVTSVSFV